MAIEVKFKEKKEEKVEQQMFSETKNPAEFISYIMGCRDVIKIMHWKTTSYAQHKALDKASDGLLDIIDSIAEKVSGYTGKHLSGFKDFSVNKYENDDCVKYIQEIKEYIQRDRYVYFSKDYSPIQNELDNLTNLLDQTLYLLSLK